MTMTCHRHRLAAAASCLLVLASACSGGKPATVKAEELPPPFTYVAVGASETVGVGADEPAAQSWPAVFYRTALARSARFVNVGESGATVRQALDRKLQPALAEEPRLVTVWLNVNDLVAQVPVEQYERDLSRLVRALRRGGEADVLVATAPPVAELPVVKACLPGGSGCRLPSPLPSAAAITQRVADYNGAIARVVAAEGAVLVDLAAATAGGISAPLVAADGFHPSTEGHRRVAAAFAQALAGMPTAAPLRPPASVPPK
jgi:acyl-CoA thioesterase-1